MDFSELKKYMDKLVDEYNVPGVDCIVCQDHKMIFRYFTGMSDIENDKKMNGNELYLIFSMTKLITCTAALQLFEQGKFKLDDPVSKFLPEFENMRIEVTESEDNSSAKIMTGRTVESTIEKKETRYAQKPITIENLFTMSAGFDYDLWDNAIKNALSEGETTTREIVGAMSEKVLGFEPGTRFRYSLCHDILGALIEIWSGQSLGEYFEEHIFALLGMKNTFFGVPKESERLERMAARYTYDEDGKPKRLPLVCIFNPTDEYESGGAGLTSCAEDYALFLDALACGGMGKTGKEILKPETVALMRTNRLSGKACEDFDKLRCGYGYGLGVRTHIDKEKSGSLSPIGEFGWDGAAGAFSMVDLENNLSLTYFQHIHEWDVKIHSEMRNVLYKCLA